jgi:subtilisin family serine protease
MAPKPSGTQLGTEINLIVLAFAKAGIGIGVAFRGPDNLDFIFQEGVILVRDAYLPAVPGVVGGGAAIDGLIDGVTLYSIAGATISGVVEALDKIDHELGAGVAAPNHVLWASIAHMCPATQPEPVPAGSGPDPGECPGLDSSGVHIYVPDTGLLADGPAHPWLAGVTGDPDPLFDPDGDGPPIRPYCGHGTFIAGVARCMAPLSHIHVASLLQFSGAQLESAIVKHLDQALDRYPDIISLSAGTTTRGNRPPLAFEALWRRYRHCKGVLMVAAASNDGDRRPFWPAAFPQVVSVGALTSDSQGRASFSDYGGWVDVYAPGEDLVNAFATGTYQYYGQPTVGEGPEVRQFDGMARWSGTSFSTPLVAGLIAARMSRMGENSRRAADALLAQARAQALAGVGPVLYPCDSGADCHCRRA